MTRLPGVGWKLKGRPLTSRGELIRVNVHPLGTVSYAEAGDPRRFPISALETRWPSYGRGFDGPHPPAVQEEILRAVFQASRVPGLPLDQYGLYSGNPTAEEIIDLYALAPTHPDKVAIMRAWEEISRPADPPPPPPPPPAPTPGRTLSPAAVRVRELRSLLGDTSSWPTALSLPLLLPDAVLAEALRFYRLLRSRLGDTRPIPQEDR